MHDGYTNGLNCTWAWVILTTYINQLYSIYFCCYQLQLIMSCQLSTAKVKNHFICGNVFTFNVCVGVCHSLSLSPKHTHAQKRWEKIARVRGKERKEWKSCQSNVRCEFLGFLSCCFFSVIISNVTKQMFVFFCMFVELVYSPRHIHIILWSTMRIWVSTHTHTHKFLRVFFTQFAVLPSAIVNGQNGKKFLCFECIYTLIKLKNECERWTKC